MKPAFFSEQDVEQLLSMEDALEAVESSLRALAGERGRNHPRRRLFVPHGAGLHAMEATVLMPPRQGHGEGRWYCGYKMYTTSREGAWYTVGLFDGASGQPLALLEGDRLGQRRTGAASGVATRLLSAPGARVVGVIGSGWQAESQLEAVCAVRKIEQIRVYSRRPESRQRFAEQMSQRLGIGVESVARVEHVVEGADILITATASREPVIAAGALPNGIHINAVGANSLQRRELDVNTVERSDRIVVDSIEQCGIEAGDLVAALGSPDGTGWARIEELGEALAANRVRSGPVRQTLFKSTGLAVWDVACAARVWERAQRG